MENSNKLIDLGNRELLLLAEALKAYANNEIEGITADLIKHENITDWGFNPSSGNVYLLGDDYTAYMVNIDGNLEAWASCGNCGHEDFISEFEFNVVCEDKCSEVMKFKEEE